MTYEPINLKRWTRPENYMGAEWPDYFSSGVGRSRDSDALERSNFRVMLRALGGESETVRVVREGHWLVGWVEWIAIHETDHPALIIADGLKASLDDYPVLDDEDFTKEEDADAQEVWSGCMTPSDRLDFIRNHRHEFEFRSLSDIRAQVRGEYFGGYASELLC